MTSNLKHFPDGALAPYNVEALHPDRFVLDLLDLAPGLVLKVIDDQVRALKKPPMELTELLDRLEGNGLVQTTAEVKGLMGMDGIG